MTALRGRGGDAEQARVAARGRHRFAAQAAEASALLAHRWVRRGDADSSRLAGLKAGLQTASAMLRAV